MVDIMDSLSAALTETSREIRKTIKAEKVKNQDTVDGIYSIKKHTW
jgi:hypothetical protein